MEIVYLGSGQFGIECLNAIKSSRHSLEFIVTQPAHPAGRGRKLQPTPVAQWAADNSVVFTQTDNVNTPELSEKIGSYEPDVIVVVAFGQKMGSELIALPSKAAINVHASLLPKLRGAAPINWAIVNGETHTGISIITLTEKMDAGLILAQGKTDIAPDETAGRLHDRLAKLAAPLLIKTLNQIESETAVYTEQDHSKATLAPKLKKSDGFLDFTEPADVLERRIRGLWPWPGAAGIYIAKRTGKQQQVTIAEARVIENQNPKNLQPGTLDDNLNIICGRNALKIIKIKPAGSGLMDFDDFVNGRQTQPGDLFVKIEK